MKDNVITYWLCENIIEVCLGISMIIIAMSLGSMAILSMLSYIGVI